MTRGTKVQLSVMMFLQFFIWGAWFVTLGTFLSKTLQSSGGEIANAFSTQSWGAIIAPFFIGLIADKYMNAEKILAILHLLGAVLLFLMGSADDFSGFYPFTLLYMIIYMPTLALVNSISFHQMSDPSKEFSLIRVFGTIGWIVAGLAISYIFHWDSQNAIASGMLRQTFYLAGGASFALGILSFTLPPTPPKISKNVAISFRDILGLDALKLLSDRNFLLFFVSSILICIPLAFYYQNTHPFITEMGLSNPTGKMAYGQMSEVVFMLFLPIFFKKYGFKITILAGMLAWALRYLLFAFGDGGSHAYMLILGIVLHGICYDFFFVSGQIYTDAKAGPHIKSAAQGLITLATYGLGMLIGFYISGQIVTKYNGDWYSIWIFPAIFAGIIFVFFGLLFRAEKINTNGYHE
ncbi:MAG: nucleoside permease [Lewinellaceae bacterium]|nr:nucleoside permease [Lewinellaceae bacterium]